MRVAMAGLVGLVWLAAAHEIAGAEYPAAFSEETWNRFLNESVIPHRAAELECVAYLPSEQSTRVFVRQDARRTTMLQAHTAGPLQFLVSEHTACNVRRLPTECKDRVRAVVSLGLRPSGPIRGVFQLGVEVAGENEDPSPIIHLPLGSLLQDIRDRTPGVVPRYSPVLRTIEVVRDPAQEPQPEGPQLRSATIQLRTPTDAERFGHHLQSFRLASDAASTSFAIRSVCGQSGHACLQFRSPDEIKAWVQTPEAGTLQASQELWSWTCRHADMEKAQRLWKLSVQFNAIGKRILNECGPDATLSGEEVRRLVEEAIPVLRANQVASAAVRDQREYGPVDDPVMLYRMAEECLTPYGTCTVLYGGLAHVLRNADLPLEVRAAYGDVAGDLGSPPLLNFDLLQGMPDAKFIEAILFSRWEWDWTPAHAEACLKVLASEPPESRAALAAVESLVRMNELPRVPPEPLQSWYAEDICRDDGDLHTGIAILSRHPSGRTFLRTRIGSGDSRFVRDAIRHALRIRAESTLRTERFDFMSHDECQSLLNDPLLAIPGRDSESGPPRPFPVDE